jgi:hypothetical protein
MTNNVKFSCRAVSCDRDEDVMVIILSYDTTLSGEDVMVIILSYDTTLSGGDYQSFGRTCCHHFPGKSKEEAHVPVQHWQPPTRFHNITWDT